MLVEKLRKSGNSYVLTIRREEVDRLGLTEGDLVAFTPHKVELRPAMRPEIGAAAGRILKRSDVRDALRYLADH